MGGFEGWKELLAGLGPHTLGKSCLDVKRLGELRLSTPRGLITRSFRATKARVAAKRCMRG